MANVKDFKKFQKLSQICDGTFGKGSSMRSGTESVILKVVDDTLISARFIMVVNFTQDSAMKQMMPRYKNEGVSMIKAALEKTIEDYEDLTGEKVVLKMDVSTIQDSAEFLSNSMYAPKKSAYYRLSVNVKVDE